MARVLFRSTGGDVSLPDPRTIMIDRADGGQLVVNPPRRVWERTALTPDELIAWSVLIAATGRAMLECLPQLQDGCLNYWDAGNWALHPDAEPAGAKTGPEHRFLHQHLIGRSPHSTDPSWRWGEAPLYPTFADRYTWSRGKAPLSASECVAIVTRLEAVLREVYGVSADEGGPWTACATCGYPASRIQMAGTPAICLTCAERVLA